MVQPRKKNEQRQKDAVVSKKPKPTPLSLADHVAVQLNKTIDLAPKRRNIRHESSTKHKKTMTAEKTTIIRKKMLVKPRNPMDGTAPRVTYRGFQRKTPKLNKQISSIKRRILAGRAEIRSLIAQRLDKKAIKSGLVIGKSFNKLTTIKAISPIQNVWLEQELPSSIKTPIVDNNASSSDISSTPLVERRKTRRGAKKNKKKVKDDFVSTASHNQATKVDCLAAMPIEIRYTLAHTLSNNRGLTKSYCDQWVSTELDTSVTILMAELIRYQTRKLQQVPIKAKIRKRYVIGFKESLRTLLLDKARCIIMAKNIEYINPSEEQLDPLVVKIQQQCHQRSIPLVYSMTRRQLGSAIGGARGHRTGGVGCIALLMIDGAESLYDRVLTLADQGRHYWQDYFCSLRPATDALTPWNSYGETPVWLASWHGYSNDVLCKCIDNGWSVDTRRQSYQSDASRDWTPLMAASYRGHAHILSILLRKGAQANVKDQMGKSALLLAIEQGHVSVVHELLKLAATLIDVNIKDNDGNTALQIAIQGKHIQIVRALLEQDQLNISDTCDDRVNEKIAMSNPLLLTIQLSLHDVLFELYQYYEQRWIVEMTEIVTATFTPRKMMLFLNSRLPLDDQGRNPFILACAIGNLTVCQTLLICMSRPISIPMPGAQKRRWKIDRAERQRQLINQPDEQGRTALWWASANGHISLASWLCGNSLDHLQIDRELKDQEGKTASDVAALYYKDWLNNTANEKLKDVAMKNQKKQTDSRIQQLVYDICRTIAKPSSKTLLPSNKNDNNDD